jgi:hypothetical protein
VQPDLERFLDANDPAELVAARRAMSTVDPADDAALHVIVADWRDEQAVVNLLMYPELLAQDDRTPALAEGLSGSHGDDAVLAACVGLAAWLAADDDAPAIAERLLRLVIDDATWSPIAVHASLALAAYAEHVAPTDLVCALVHDDPVVRHNVLAAVLGGWGGVEALAAVRAAADSGLVPRSVADEVHEAVVGAGLADVDEPIHHRRLVTAVAAPPITSSIAVPIPAPIPLLGVWSATAASAV